MNQDIIDIYRSVLLRTPEQYEVDYWAEVEVNNSLEFVRDAIVASSEGVHVQTILLPIIGLYQGLLGRAPEMDGLTFWSDAIAGGDLTFQDLIGSFVSSTEFQTNNPDLGVDVSATELATLFYSNLLGRAPDAAGLEFWTGLLSSGDLTVETFTAAFINSPETQDLIGQQIFDFRTDILDGAIDNPGGSMLPDPDVASYSFGDVSPVAMDGPNNLWTGSGNEADNFAVLTTSTSNIELALKGYIRSGGGDTEIVTQNDGNHSVYTFAPYDKAGFAFSVASLDGKPLADMIAEGYSFTLTIDTDPDAAGVSGPTLTLTETGNWVGTWKDTTYNLSDSEGDLLGAVSQNIQTSLWYDGDPTNDALGTLDAGTYTISLGVNTGDKVFTHSIDLNVLEYVQDVAFNGTIDTLAQDGSGNMIAGGGNPANEFSVVTVSGRGGELFEIALGAQNRGGPVMDDANQDGVYNFGIHNEAMLKFSVTDLVAGQDLSDLIGDYDFKLNVDRDPTSGTDFATLILKDDGLGNLIWEVQNYEDGTGNARYALDDNASNDNVSQNIQALSWYQDVDGDLFGPGYASEAGTYDVSLEVFETGTDFLVGANTIQMVVEAA